MLWQWSLVSSRPDSLCHSGLAWGPVPQAAPMLLGCAFNVACEAGLRPLMYALHDCAGMLPFQVCNRHSAAYNAFLGPLLCCRCPPLQA